MKLHAGKLSSAGAIIAAIGMLLLTLGDKIGFYEGAVQQMQKWHMFYEPTFIGTITGMIEAAIHTYITIFVLIWIYNKLLGKKK